MKEQPEVHVESPEGGAATTAAATRLQDRLRAGLAYADRNVDRLGRIAQI